MSNGLVKMPAGWYVHESAYVDEIDKARIGAGTRIWHYCHVMRGAVIGSDCQLGQSCFVDRDAVIGDGCKLQNHVSVYAAVKLEDEVFCGPAATFTNVKNPRAFIERKEEFKPTVVGRGATIGANATIVCGVTIGRYAFVGAGAVVTKDVHDFELVVGAPARVIGHVSRAGHRLQWAYDADVVARKRGAKKEWWSMYCSAACPEGGERYIRAPKVKERDWELVVPEEEDIGG